MSKIALTETEINEVLAPLKVLHAQVGDVLHQDALAALEKYLSKFPDGVVIPAQSAFLAGFIAEVV